MSLEINLVNLGTYPNDGSGDDLRTAFEKTNANFASLEENVVLSAINLGTGTPIWLDKVGNDLRFRSIRSQDDNLAISYDSNEIILKVKDFLEFVEDDTSPSLGGNLNLNGFEIDGIGDIDIEGVVIAHGFEGALFGTVFGDLFGSVFGNVTGNVTGQVSDISNHVLEELNNVSSATPEANNGLVWNGTLWEAKPLVTRIIAGNNVVITPVEGTGDLTIDVPDSASSLNELTDVEITNPTTGQIIQYNGTSWVNSNFDFNLNSYDFGLLSGVSNQFDLLFQFTNIDFGTLNNPSSVKFDLGFIDVEVPPTYQLTSNLLSVSEGSSVIITLNTTGISNGTLVPYTITGVTSQDINGSSLTGSFVVTNNTDTLTIPITIDLLTEEETLTLTLTGITPEVSVSVNITDIVLPDDIDGGTPSTTIFDLEFDGGNPSVLSFDIVLDGGEIEGLGVLPAIIDGGSPLSVASVVLDGETPTSSITAILDAEFIV